MALGEGSVIQFIRMASNWPVTQAGPNRGHVGGVDVHLNAVRPELRLDQLRVDAPCGRCWWGT